MKLKRLALLLVFFPATLFAQQFSALPQGLIGGKRTLVEAWPMDEGRGTVTKGLNGNTGDLLSGPTWVKGTQGNALNFAATNSRVEVRNESRFDFITLTSTWTLIVKFRTTKLLAGILFSKTGTFNSPAGFYIQAESDATGDLAFKPILSASPAGWVTPVIPLAEVGGNVPRILIFDFCASSSGTSPGQAAAEANVAFFINSRRLSFTTKTFRLGDITNDNLAVISGWDDGTSTSFNGIIEMVALYRGDGHGALSDGDARMITERFTRR